EKKKMLIVEDDKALSLVLSKYYGRHYEVKTASNSNECQETIRRYTPDIVLLDYYLPGKTGGELFSIIKNAAPEARIIILSANESSQTVVDLIKLGVRDYVVKGNNAIEEIDEILGTPKEE
ncbi:response regulator, partial [Fulvivirga sp. RKSG066]|uniref:response regulator n=1 Tax=Fulvivirga aurantia TaxID=2529383 RepID=UPI0012BC3CF0